MKMYKMRWDTAIETVEKSNPTVDLKSCQIDFLKQKEIPLNIREEYNLIIKTPSDNKCYQK